MNLTSEEISYLIEILEREISETKSEIHHSDDYDFKERLKNRIKFIQEIISKLGVSVKA